MTSYQEKLALLRSQMKDPDEEKANHEKIAAAQKKLAFEKEKRAKRAADNRRPLSENDKVDLELRISNLEEKNTHEHDAKHVSQAKAAGLKSIFALPDSELLMTSFGKGNAAVCEKLIVGNEITDITALPAFTAQHKQKQFLINGRLTKHASADNPITSKKTPGQDLIGCREQLEQMFFGSTYPDNIHIQLAYSILDIDKILTVHINNIIYQLNNLLREENEQGLVFNDVVGNIGLDRTAEVFWKEAGQKLQEDVRTLLKAPQLAYFGDVLYDSNLLKMVKSAKDQYAKDKALEKLRQKENDAFNLLSLLGMIRQALAHGSEGARTTIYTLDKMYDAMYKKNQVPKVNADQRIAARETLDKMYAARIADLNNGFLKKAKVDLQILFSIYSAILPEDKMVLVQEYYDFIIRKEYKNQGFSVKHLRELILLQKDANQILSTEYDSMRARMYRMLDMMISKYYRQHDEQANCLVESLRASIDSKQKEHIYQEEAKKVWAALRLRVLRELLPWMVGEELGNTSKAAGDPDVTQKMILDVAIKQDTYEFCKLIYLMTCFLDGKEINDLLTTLINKFETIHSFIAVMKAQEIPCKFTRGYGLFNKSGEIAHELRAINSFARMSDPSPDAKRIMFIEAAQVLGYPGNKESLDKYIDNILTAKDNGKGFRNFIINNVIESDRFKYLVRYANMKTVRKIADNRKVVTFVLKDIPDSQIIRYYNSCTSSARDRCTPDMRDELVNLITGISFEQFADVKQKATGNTPDAQDKTRKQAIIRLYLAVLYLAVKNLVYVNSRYFLAFHCVERDSIIFDPAYNKAYKGRKKDFSQFARARIDQGCLNGRATRYIQQNMANSDPLMVQGFRNCVDHLGAVRCADLFIADIADVDSYFGLYHYLVQRYLKADLEQDPHVTEDMINAKILGYLKLVEKYHTYCKDMVKALNVPFAYNLPRYKNLSIAELFDKNNYLPEKGKTAALSPDDAD